MPKNGVTVWIHNWKRNGWKNAARQPVKDQDLWRQLDGNRLARHITRWTWTKGHASHADNNRADQLAARAAQEQSASGSSSIE